MDQQEAARLAKLSAPDDPIQQRLTERALREVGEHRLSVREVPGDPPWQAYNIDSGRPITFAGLYIYGGDTRELAMEATRRIASKWDWEVIEPEALDG